jgi:hypothetical protein
MAYTATELITKSFYLSGIVARDLQTVTGAQISEGLDLLNEILSRQAVNVKMIPYYQEFDLTAVQGQETYFIPNLIEAETFTFNIGPVRYATSALSRTEYFGTGRIDNIHSLPVTWHYERTLGGSNIYLYFLPYQTFPLKIWGKAGLTDVTFSTDLSTVYDLFYISYLRYALAEYICEDYNIDVPPRTLNRLKAYEEDFQTISVPDMTVHKVSTFGSTPVLNWGDVNFSKGWRP